MTKEDENKSLIILRNFIRFAVSQIAFHKKLLPRSSFVACVNPFSRGKSNDNEIEESSSTLYLIDAVDTDNGHIKCEKGYRITQWLEKGIFPALNRGFVKGFKVLLFETISNYVNHEIMTPTLVAQNPQTMSNIGNHNHCNKQNNIKSVMEIFHFQIDELLEINKTNSTIKDNVALSDEMRNLIALLNSHSQHELDQGFLNNVKSNDRMKRIDKPVALTFVLDYTELVPIDFTPVFFSRANKINPFLFRSESEKDINTNANEQNETKLFESTQQVFSQLHQSLSSKSEETNEKMDNILKQKHICLGSFKTASHRLHLAHRLFVMKKKAKLSILDNEPLLIPESSKLAISPCDANKKSVTNFIPHKNEQKRCELDLAPRDGKDEGFKQSMRKFPQQNSQTHQAFNEVSLTNVATTPNTDRISSENKFKIEVNENLIGSKTPKVMSPPILKRKNNKVKNSSAISTPCQKKSLRLRVSPFTPTYPDSAQIQNRNGQSDKKSSSPSLIATLHNNTSIAIQQEHKNSGTSPNNMSNCNCSEAPTVIISETALTYGSSCVTPIRRY